MVIGKTRQAEGKTVLRHMEGTSMEISRTGESLWLEQGRTGEVDGEKAVEPGRGQIGPQRPTRRSVEYFRSVLESRWRV